jgi:hypothetical protein
MSLDINKFARKTFYVDAVTVTDDNMSQVAEWCSGSVHDLQDGGNDEGYTHYIKVQVHRPLNERQTRAFVGDRVLRRSDYHAGSGFKVFTPIAFDKSFEAVGEESKEENLITEIFSGGTDGDDLGRSPA